jgi:2-iminobutanoate/2-iminopropanoate deaminase
MEQTDTTLPDRRDPLLCRRNRNHIIANHDATGPFPSGEGFSPEARSAKTGSCCITMIARRASAFKLAPMKKIISTSEAPGAIGPYSQAVRSGSFLFCSGQIPLDPKSGQIVPGDIAIQTRRVLDNISAILKAEGLTFDHVVKTTIFLTDLGDFQTVNEIYGSYFKQDPPARSTVQVAALPKGANVEIEVIATANAGGSNAPVAYDTSG